MTTSLAERYARQLDEIGRLVIAMHTHDVYDAERDEWEINTRICRACDIERILDREPPCPE